MNRIKESYEPIQAGEELISSTRERLSQIRQMEEGKDKKKNRHYKPVWIMAVTFAMIAVILIVHSYSLSTQAASYISIDATPSIELTLNKNNKVIKAEGYNDSGKKVLEGLSLKGMDYKDALSRLFASDEMKSYKEEKESYTVTVVSSDQKTQTSLLKNLQSSESLNSQKTTATAESVSFHEEAHHNHMTAGRYAAYLALKSLDESVSVEDCHDMSMGEIEDCIESHEEHGEEEECNHKENSCDHEEEDCDH